MAKATQTIDHEADQASETADGQVASEQRAVAVAKQRSRAPAPISAMTPMDMLSFAVQNNQGMAVIEKLMDLQERWQKTEARKQFDAAMSRVHVPVVYKNRQVDFTSAKGRTNYVYEDLAEISKTVRPALAEHGLSFRFQTVQRTADEVTVICRIAHESGHFEENSLTAKLDVSGNKNHIQAIGSTVTFLERYTLKAALGIAASDDDDGAGAGADQETPVPSASQPKAEPEPRREPNKPKPEKPYAIKANTAEEWAAAYISKISAARSTEEIDQWDAVNGKALDKMHNEFPDILERINVAENARKVALAAQSAAQSAPKADKITTGPQPTHAPTKAETVASGASPWPPTLPDPEQDYDGFVQEAAEALKNWDNAEKLEELWTVHIAIDGLLKPDHDNLLSLYRQAEKRLGG